MPDRHSPVDNMTAYIAIARNLRDFGYPDVSGVMIQEIHEAMKAGAPLPHGVIGMFAKGQLEENGLA
jgi:hypothetical protein